MLTKNSKTTWLF